MNPQCPDHLTRRKSLTALIATGLAGILAQAQAGDAKRSNRKKAKKKCKKQEAQCVTALTPLCEGDPNCASQFQQCCASTARCDITGFFACVEQHD